MATKYVGQYASANNSALIVHVPDTQFISLTYPGLYAQMASAIIALNPALVVHTGDAVDGCTAAEWTAFRDNFWNPLNSAGLKLAFCPGNHDYQASDRTTNMDTYLSKQSWQTAKDSGKIANTYGTVSIGGVTYLVLCLEWSPRTATVTWAQGVLASYPTTPVILLTHAYLYDDGTRYDWPVKGSAQLWNPNDPAFQFTAASGINDGEALWQSLVKGGKIRFVFCGHVAHDTGSVAHLRSTRDDGKSCDQFLLNFQGCFSGGASYFMGLRLDLANSKIYAQTYNPYIKIALPTPALAFNLSL